LFETIAPAFELQQVAAMQEAILNRRRSGVIAKEFTPILQGPIRCQHRAFSRSIAIQNDFKKIIGSLFGDVLSQKKIIDDQKIGFGEKPGHFLSSPELVGFKEVFEKDMGFAVHDFVTGLNGGIGHCFGYVAFAGSGRAYKQGIGAIPDKLAADKLPNRTRSGWDGPEDRML
jgi:hypothetical protein